MKQQSAVTLGSTLLILDQLTKLIVVLLPSIFHPLYNTGLTFGFFQGSNLIMVFVSLLALGLVTWLFLKAKAEERFGLALLLAGITGNLIDRIFREGVVDFIRVGSFPVFNLADSCIVSGIIYLLLLEIPSVNKWVKKTFVSH